MCILAAPLQPRNRLEHTMTTMKTLCTRSGVCLGGVALLALTTAATACTGRQQEAPPATTTAAEPLRGRRAHPGHRLAARRPPGSGAARGGQAVHRRLRRDGQAPRDSRGRDVQPHALLHRQGARARVDLRGAQVIRERSEHGPEDGQSQGACGDRADVARSAGSIPLEGQGGHDRGDGDGQARTGGASPPSPSRRAPT